MNDSTRTRETDMEVRCERDSEVDGAKVAAPIGRLDAASVDDFWQAVSDALDGSTPSLMLDLSRVQLVTSAGLGIMVRMLLRTLALGGRMSVFGANAKVRSVIDAVMLNEVLAVCDTIDEARARIRAATPGPKKSGRP